MTLEWESDMPTGSESLGEGRRQKTGAMESVWLLGYSDVSLSAVKS